MQLLQTPRQRLYAEAARLAALRDDLDPTGSAYERLSEEIDQVLEQIWWLGPVTP